MRRGLEPARISNVLNYRTPAHTLRIAVLAATPYDTQLGCTMLEEQAVACDGFTLSPTPAAQADTQYFKPAELERRVRCFVQELSADTYSCLVLFCNSLSTGK